MHSNHQGRPTPYLFDQHVTGIEVKSCYVIFRHSTSDKNIKEVIVNIARNVCRYLHMIS